MPPHGPFFTVRVSSGVDLRREQNELALQAYLIMDQGLDLQDWLEEQCSLQSDDS